MELEDQEVAAEARAWIARLGLRPHPEGGYFTETYRSTVSLRPDFLPEGYRGSRSVSTAIYYLLTGDSFSAFHRLRADEIWHFYAGSPVEIYQLVGGRVPALTISRLGIDLVIHSFPQVVVPAGSWFAAQVIAPGGFALVGCTVAPGFDTEDFELANRQELMAAFPAHIDLIRTLTRD